MYRSRGDADGGLASIACLKAQNDRIGGSLLVALPTLMLSGALLAQRYITKHHENEHLTHRTS
ncbi:hypothetical protein [Streptomyces sp. NBC_00286]|uniref:hypothetical protein n=1 Tax=Streptomyces sp. NBC_00286 TaxID=2975701 RepID=UPI002E28F52F|nr:hypothetical protein [Streptomyces sp. NBC_00286]